MAALPLLQATIWAVAVALLTTRSVFSLGGGPLVLLLALALVWPVGYIVGTAGRQRWRGRTAPA